MSGHVVFSCVAIVAALVVAGVAPDQIPPAKSEPRPAPAAQADPLTIADGKVADQLRKDLLAVRREGEFYASHPLPEQRWFYFLNPPYLECVGNWPVPVATGAAREMVVHKPWDSGQPGYSGYSREVASVMLYTKVREAPRRVFEMVLAMIADIEENADWRTFLLEFCIQEFNGRLADDVFNSRLRPLCCKIAMSEEEPWSVRLAALVCLGSRANGRSWQAYMKCPAYLPHCAGDAGKKADGLRAAWKAGFVNPHEEELREAAETTLAAFGGEAVPEEFRSWEPILLCTILTTIHDDGIRRAAVVHMLSRVTGNDEASLECMFSADYTLMGMEKPDDELKATLARLYARLGETERTSKPPQ